MRLPYANCRLPLLVHPLNSMVCFEDIRLDPSARWGTMQSAFYLLGLKRDTGVLMKYGRQEYGFDGGLMFFTAPGQVYTTTNAKIPLSDGATIILTVSVYAKLKAKHLSHI